MGLCLALGMEADQRPVDDLRLPLNFAANEGEIRPFPGVQGAPAPLDPSDSDLTAQYREAGIRIVRIPQDDGFATSLAGIYPDSSKSLDDPASFHFEAIDRLMRSVIEAGAVPLWTASYDIGGGDRWSTTNSQAGRPPRDAAKWAMVIRRVLEHWNEAWGNGSRWNVRHVEFINEPFTLGGFDHRRPAACWRTYEVFVRAIRKYNEETGRKVQVAAFGEAIRAGGLETRLRLVDSFLEFTREKSCAPDIFTYHSYETPDGQLKVARALRERLDRAGLGHVPLWNSEWNISPKLMSQELRDRSRLWMNRGFRDWIESASWPYYYPETADLMRRAALDYSAYVAAHNAQVKTLLQDYCAEMITYRANRGAARMVKRASEYMYFESAGDPKPAYFLWVAFKRLAEFSPQRIAAYATGPVTVLAGRSEDGVRWGSVIANWSEAPTRASLEIARLPSGSTWTARRFRIDGRMVRWRAVDEQILSADSNGRLTVAINQVPGTSDYWEFERLTTPLIFP